MSQYAQITRDLMCFKRRYTRNESLVRRALSVLLIVCRTILMVSYDLPSQLWIGVKCDWWRRVPATGIGERRYNFPAGELVAIGVLGEVLLAWIIVDYLTMIVLIVLDWWIIVDCLVISKQWTIIQANKIHRNLAKQSTVIQANETHTNLAIQSTII